LLDLLEFTMHSTPSAFGRRHAFLSRHSTRGWRQTPSRLDAGQPCDAPRQSPLSPDAFLGDAGRIP